MPTKNTQQLLAAYRSFQWDFPWSVGKGGQDATTRTWVTQQRITSANHVKWKARMKDGLDVTTSLYGTRYYYKPSDGRAQVRFQNSGLTGGSDIIGQVAGGNTPTNPGVVASSIVTSVTSQAQIAFAKNYRKKTNNWSSGVFCGELVETARMLASPAKSLRKGVDTLYSELKRTLKGVKPGKNAGRATSRAVAGTYLEWKFGVDPLIQDLDDAAEAFRGMASGRCFDQIRITGEAEDKAFVDSQIQTWNPNVGFPGFSSGSHLQVRMDTWDECEVTYRGAWKNSNPSGEMPLPMRFGLGVNDILPTAWELVPWSFLVDYFVNVGDVLDAWGMRMVNFSWMNRTTRSRRTVRQSDFIAANVPPFNSVGSYGGHVVSKRFEVTRVPTTNAFDTGFAVSVPGFPGSKKWLNISALLAMRIKP